MEWSLSVNLQTVFSSLLANMSIRSVVCSLIRSVKGSLSKLHLPEQLSGGGGGGGRLDSIFRSIS